MDTCFHASPRRDIMYLSRYVLLNFTLQCLVAADDASDGGVSLATRHHWMRRANEALNEVRGTPCPSEAFGSVIVNHTAAAAAGDGDGDGGGLGQLVCIGANDVLSGNPTIHGEIAAINNCTAVLADPNGPYRLSGAQIREAWADLSLYTNAEPCPMCASAIRWAGFRELVFGSDTLSLQSRGWSMISLSAQDLFAYAESLPTETSVLGGVLSNETDVYFGWQFDAGADCPEGCQRFGGICQKDGGGARRRVAEL